MVVNFFRTLIGSRRNGRNAEGRRNATANYFRPRVERLEEREPPAVDTWTGGAGMNNQLWTTPNNWSLLRAPGAGDTAVFDNTAGQPNVTVNLAASVVSLQLVNSYAGIMTLGANLTVTGAGGFKMSSGTITANAGNSLTISGGNNPHSTWSGGTVQGAGSLVVAATAVLDISGSVNLGSETVNSGTLTNNGTVNWVTGTIATNNATVNNAGTFTAQNDSKLTYIGAANGPFGNFNITGAGGQFQKTGGTGQGTQMNIPFNVGSTKNPAVDVRTGNLILQHGGTITSTCNAVLNSSISISVPQGTGGTDQTYNFNAGATFTGQGFVFLSSQSVSLTVPKATATIPANTTVNATNFELSGGVLTGAGTLSVSQKLNWDFGSMTGTGATTVTGTSTIGGDNDLKGLPPTLDQRTFNNQGTLQLSGPTQLGPITFAAQNGATINNSGTFKVADDSSVLQTLGAAASSFNNSGTLQKTGGTGTSEIGVTYTESGTGTTKRQSGKWKFSGAKVSILGGTFDAAGGLVQVTGDYQQSAGTTTVNGGSLTIGGNLLENGGTLTLGGGSLSAGTIQVASGAVLSGPGSLTGPVTNGGEIDVAPSGSPGTLAVTGNYTQTAGATDFFGSSTLTVSGSFVEQGGSVTLSGDTLQVNGGLQGQGGTLQGSGTIVADVVNSGAIMVAGTGATGTLVIASNSSLGISGNYTQNSGGTLDMEIGGASQYDKLQVAGLATLAGTLNVTLLNGFTPSSGQVFSLLTYGSRSNTFTTLNLPSFGGTWNPQYDNPPNTFSLWVV
jgi:hypothetical protein